MKRIGFGQVEPNHLSAKRTGQIYAQLPAADSLAILENGQYVKYDYKAGEVNLDGAGEWMLVYNEIKLYENGGYKDFALISANAVGGHAVPRVFKTNIGDIYTTNCVGVANTDKNKEVNDSVDYAEGDILVPGEDGYLAKKESPAATDMQWQVVKVYTLADGQSAVKLMRIA